MVDAPSLTQRLTFRLQYELRHAWESTAAAVQGNGITAYWYRDVLNFGDLITPLLLRHYGYTPVFARHAQAQLVATGSILEHLCDDYAGIILGSGFIDETSNMTFPKARVLAVRGKLTRQRLGENRKTVALGDPGLLASVVMPRREEKSYVLGVVPHYSEKNHPQLLQLLARLGPDATLIDAQAEPLKVFAAIDRCKHILSSSLHGLIVADSLGIPNRWLAPAIGLHGGRFKFDDYYSSLGLDAEPGVLTGMELLSQLLVLTRPTAASRIQDTKLALASLWASLDS
jgi:hypothetical protein